MDILDKLIADDKEMSKMLKEGRTPFATPLNENMCEALFGTKSLFQAVVTGEMKPQFDYRAEMEKAKAAMPEMIKTLKLDD
ncbi:MAG: hypothetical protein HZA50_11085 [Planctomycetes bacterium]|nr:hypothetical protein [Planctomycetota bacterium]